MQNTPFRTRHGLIVETTTNNRTAIVSNTQVVTGTSNNSLLDLAALWNTSSNPSAIKLNITNVASNANSTLMNLQVDSNSRFIVDVAGNVLVGRTNSTVGQNVKLDVNGAINASAILVNNAPLQTTSLTSNVVISVSDNTNAALRITQTGTGAAIRVEDSANPDSTPFVVDANGKVLIGSTDARNNFLNASLASAALQVEGAGAGAAEGSTIAAIRNSSGSTGPRFLFAKSKGTTVGSNVLVQSGDNLGIITFQGSDGSEFVEGALITATVDGTAASDSMPTRLEFHTSNTIAITERMRIDPTGNVLIGRTDSTVGQNVKLDVNGAANTSDILVNGTSVSPLGQQTIWVPASAMYPKAIAGAAQGTIVTPTNSLTIKTLDFDTATYEFAQFVIQMPKSWNEGTLIFQFIWTHAATTTNFGVVWVVRSTAYANDDALDVTLSNDTGVADTGGTTNDIYITGETPPHTVPGSPAAEELVLFEIYRDYPNVSDTMAVDARLIGVKIHYTVDAAKDD